MHVRTFWGSEDILAGYSFEEGGGLRSGLGLGFSCEGSGEGRAMACQ